MTNVRALGLLVLLPAALGDRVTIGRAGDVHATDVRAPDAGVVANDNRSPAGTLANGVLTLHLRITHGMWHPDGDSAPGADIIAFAEDGHAASVPGPLVRVPVGTEIRTSVHNALTDSSVVIYGLSGARGPTDTVRVQPGETRELTTRLTAPGTFMYRGLRWVRDGRTDSRLGSDGMLAGALVVDPANVSGHPASDRVLLILQWRDTVRLHPNAPDEGEELLTINGRSWPATERLQYQLGDTIRWRVVNASFDVHPMHLHGAFFTVLDHGSMSADTAVAVADRRQEVTQRMMPLTTMMVQWVPAHAGNWLFHCHLNFHLVMHGGFAARPVASAMPGMGGPRMAGLIMGVTVHGPVVADARPRRWLRLVAEQYDSVAGDFVPPFSFEANDARRMTIPAAPIIVEQGEPIAITVVNHLREATSVHWHGLEIQSYYDGVPGFDGNGTRIAPLIAPRDSFVARMTPPRAGTFIFHSHFDDIRQQGGGMYGAFIVLPRGTHWDAAHERVIMLGEARDTGALKINGVDHPTIAMVRGQTYRLRFVNITLDRPAISLTLTRDSTVQRWRPIARDGADLAAAQRREVPARLPITIGETDDIEFTPAGSGTYTLDVRTGKGQLLRSAAIAVTEPR